MDQKHLKWALVFVTLLLSIGSNLADGFLARLGVDANILLVGLIAFVIAGLVASQRMALIVLVCLLAIGANLGIERADAMGVNPDLLLAALVALVLAPFVVRNL